MLNGSPDFTGKYFQVGPNFNADFSDLFEKISQISVDQRKNPCSLIEFPFNSVESV